MGAKKGTGKAFGILVFTGANMATKSERDVVVPMGKTIDGVPRVDPMLCKELNENLPKTVQGAMAARGFEDLGNFLFFWAKSLTHSRDKSLMSVTSAIGLWNEAMKLGLWKGAALSLNLPVKLKALGGTGRIQRFLQDLGEDLTDGGEEE